MADSPETTPADEEFSEESARRMILRALAALVAFVFCAGVALALTRSDEGGEDVTVSPDVAFAGNGEGPLKGADVASYLETRNRALREAKGRWVAVVSFRDYVTYDQYKALFAEGDVKALLVAAEAGDPDVVVVEGAGGLTGWVAETRTEAEEERRQLESMAATTDDKAFQDQFRKDVVRLDRLVRGLDARKPVVFGMVVTGSADALRKLAERPEIRLVDLIGRRAPADVTRVRGLRPEETIRAGDPHSRP